jgi:hypothetical protein
MPMCFRCCGLSQTIKFEARGELTGRIAAHCSTREAFLPAQPPIVSSSKYFT